MIVSRARTSIAVEEYVHRGALRSLSPAIEALARRTGVAGPFMRRVMRRTRGAVRSGTRATVRSVVQVELPPVSVAFARKLKFVFVAESSAVVKLASNG